MSALTAIRTAVPAQAREKFYVVAGAVVALLASWGVVGESVTQQWTAFAVSVVALVFAIIHSTDSWRTGLYGTLLAAQGLGQVYGLLTESQWASILGLAAAVLGIAVAAAKTPTVIDGEVEHVSDTELQPTLGLRDSDTEG
ncbi:hypothetical protein JOJ86_005879 [Rhodococcus percolatus]|uniref:phage holin n=1 Tax=Rhodococcus opacus TaxID=37919 RepID=UPI001AE51D4F|nr:hypothetical protein [Rhodococcus opacus]MBP2208153.1 hypothetical protein [Rhodococcus opacus]